MLSLPLHHPDSISRAATCLREGGLVVFPTETVYGLGADAENDHAVARIFSVKGRPSFNPLIVHVADKDMAARYGEMTPLAHRLAEHFWPGPLTLVVPRAPDAPLSLLCSAGLNTVALRIPAHPEAQALVSALQRGIAAPSANRSGRLSPTSERHVQEEYAASLAAGGEAPDMLLVGEACVVGVESTIINACGPLPVILRPGSITREMLLSIIPDISDYHGQEVQAPGMMASHYAPRLPLRMNATHVEPHEALLAFGAHPLIGGVMTAQLSVMGSLTEAAANLFHALHQLDDSSAQGIAVMPIPETGIGCAINDRLRRAAAPRA